MMPEPTWVEPEVPSLIWVAWLLELLPSYCRLRELLPVEPEVDSTRGAPPVPTMLTLPAESVSTPEEPLSPRLLMTEETGTMPSSLSCEVPPRAS